MKVRPNRNPGGVVVELGPNEREVPGAAVETGAQTLRAFHIKRIVVPTDFSECSKKALRYAVPVAEQFGARITLVYIGQAYYMSPDVAPYCMNEVELQERSVSHDRLSELARDVIVDRVPTDLLVRYGEPAMEVAGAAKELGADLIVVSTHGYKGMKHAWYGSLSEKIVRHAPCPVLVVKENEHEFVA